MILKQWKLWVCAGWMPLYFSNDTNQQSNPETTTENQDNRTVASEGGVASTISRSDNNTISIHTTDRGAVESSFNFARQISKDSVNASSNALNKAMEATENAMESVQSAYANESATLKDAYSTAKAGEQKMFGVAVFGMMALALIKMFERK